MADAINNLMSQTYQALKNYGMLLGSKVTTPLHTLSILSDHTGMTPFVSTFGDLTTGERQNNINIAFKFNNGNEGIVPFLKKTIIETTGTAIQSNENETAFLESGTGVGFAELKSINLNRYIAGHGNVDLETMVFPNGCEDGVDCGVGYGSISGEDFIGYGYQNSIFGIWLKLRGVEDFIPQTSWNNKLNGGSFVLDPTKENIGLKKFGWLGVADIVFSVNTSNTKKEDWCEVYRHKTANVDSKPHMTEPTQPVSMFIRRNSGAGNNIKVGTSSWYAGTIGTRASGTGSDLYPFMEINDVSVPSNTETQLITIRTKDLFQGKANTIAAQYGTLTLVSDGNKPVSFRVYKNIADRNTGTWTDYDTNASALEGTTDATLNITTRTFAGKTLRNEQLGGTYLQKEDIVRINLFGEGSDVPITAYPEAGESITITALSSNSTVIQLMLRGIEKN